MSNTNDPFEDLNLQEELSPDRWQDMGTTLHTPTFEAYIGVDGYPYLHLTTNGFTRQEAETLTRFLVDQGLCPPKEPVYDFSDFHPQRVDEERGDK